jgi:pyruvate dehydrogenase E2 component (dihydrolipoamide acetyltransferase)
MSDRPGDAVARVTLTLPKTGDTADSVLVLEWLAAVGERVVRGRPVLQVETAKGNAEIPSTVDGILVEQLVGVDEEIDVGTPLAVIETD